MGIKQVLGYSQKKTAPLKSATGEIIQDRAQQMESWVEHYSELYAREDMVSQEEGKDDGCCAPCVVEFRYTMKFVLCNATDIELLFNMARNTARDGHILQVRNSAQYCTTLAVVVLHGSFSLIGLLTFDVRSMFAFMKSFVMPS